MYVNVTDLGGIICKSSWDDRTVLELRIHTEEMKYPITPYLHTRAHIELFISYLRCEQSAIERLAFADGSYNICAIGHRGFQVRQAMHSQIDFCVFPGADLASRLESSLVSFDAALHVSPKDRRASFGFTERELARMKAEYAPLVRLVFAEPYCDRESARERFLRCAAGPFGGFEPTEEKRTLMNCLAGELAVARNFSDGLPVTVTLSSDGHPDSFHVTIHDHDHSLIQNGGIIFHGDDWGYSGHH